MMARDLGFRIVSVLRERSMSSVGNATVADLVAQLRASENDIRDNLLLLEIEGLVKEVSLFTGGSAYEITQMGEAYVIRAGGS